MPKYFDPNKINDDFVEEREILDYRPKFEYEEPVGDDDEVYIEPTEEITVDDIKQQVKDLKQAYKQIETFADALSSRIDNRVGDYSVSLDKNVDSSVIAAIKRCFPELKNPNNINYEMYSQCLERQKLHAEKTQHISQNELDSNLYSPFQTKFGAYGKPAGTSRNEVNNPMNDIVQPIDLEAFKKAGIIELFFEMKDLITKLVIDKIKELVSPF